jgi:hypothetical protein
VLLSGQAAPGAAYRIMRIKQADFRTIQIEKLSLSCQLRYSLYQDGEIRYPESISCRGDTVVAYFLTSTIRDFFSETAYGFCIERHWNIATEGSFGFNFCLELPTDPEMAYLFPGVSSGRPLPLSGELSSGERTCYANGLFLFSNPASVLVFSDPPASTEEAGSIEAKRLQRENETDFARIEVRVPAAVKPAEKRSRRAREEGLFFRSDGQLQYDLRLNVVTAPPDQIYRRGISAVLERGKTLLHSPPRLSPESIRDSLGNQVEECLKVFLIDRGPLCGLLETKGGNILSSLAGCTLALMQLRFLPADTDAVELALRLADFSLKGQHPRGQFYPHYRMDRKSWLPAESPVAVALHRSAAIALMLLRIAAALESKGIPSSAYLQAASHMGDSLLQSNQDLEDIAGLLYPDSLLSAGTAASGPGEGAAVLVELFLELQKVTGKDKYRKAVRALKSGFFSQKSQPGFLLGPGENTADLDAILIHAQAAVSLDTSGYPVKGLHHYFDALLSRIHLNSPGSGSDFNPVGGSNHTLGNPILLFRGFELSHTLLTLDKRMNKSARLEKLKLLVSQLLAFTLQKPPGTSCFDPTQKRSDRFGALSSSIWARESYYMSRLLEEFPDSAAG